MVHNSPLFHPDYDRIEMVVPPSSRSLPPPPHPASLLSAPSLEAGHLCQQPREPSVALLAWIWSKGVR